MGQCGLDGGSLGGRRLLLLAAPREPQRQDEEADPREQQREPRDDRKVRDVLSEIRPVESSRKRGLGHPEADMEGLALFIFLAIALQNVPEGTSIAIPMESAGFSRGQQFWAAVLTRAPQPVGTVVAYLAVEEIHGLLPFSFAFAAGAMLALVFVELVPEAYAAGGRIAAAAGTALGAVLMLVLAALLGV